MSGYLQTTSKSYHVMVARNLLIDLLLAPIETFVQFDFALVILAVVGSRSSSLILRLDNLCWFEGFGRSVLQSSWRLRIVMLMATFRLPLPMISRISWLEMSKSYLIAST